MFSLIIATDTKGGIGKEGKIPWKEPNDLKWFQNTTRNGVVVFGRKTWQSLPVNMARLERIFIILTTDICLNEPTDRHIYYVSNIDQLMSLRTEIFVDREWFIAGGSFLYNYFLENDQLLKKIYWTSIHKDYDCDVRIKIDIASKFGNHSRWTKKLIDTKLNNGESYIFSFR